LHVHLPLSSSNAHNNSAMSIVVHTLNNTNHFKIKFLPRFPATFYNDRVSSRVQRCAVMQRCSRESRIDGTGQKNYRKARKRDDSEDEPWKHLRPVLDAGCCCCCYASCVALETGDVRQRRQIECTH